MSWQKLADEDSELAEFGRERFSSRVAYLATTKSDGSPRVHPVTPFIGGDGELFIFMEPTSPKGHDLRRNGYYALHASVENEEGGKGEFYISGRAFLIDDPPLRESAAKHAGYNVADRYILFRLDIAEALGTVYEEEGPVRRRWKNTKSRP